MLKLILMRHAKSSWDDPLQPDHDRPLNKRGQKSAKAMGDWLRSNGHAPDLAVSSTSRRTMETFERLALDCPISFTKELYHASAHTMLAQLHAAQGSSVLILGHNPGIAEFADSILSLSPDHPDFHRYPTCATLIANFDVANWQDVKWSSGAAIDFATPRDIISVS